MIVDYDKIHKEWIRSFSPTELRDVIGIIGNVVNDDDDDDEDDEDENDDDEWCSQPSDIKESPRASV